MQSVLDGLKEAEAIVFNGRENMQGETYRQLCDAIQTVYNQAEALQAGNGGSEDEEEEEGGPSDEEEDEESDQEPVERTENDMELNELSDLWEDQFDFDRPSAVRPIEDLIEIITMDLEEKRVCAAVRVLNRALHRSKPDDPEDAERILKWKEDLVEQGAIKECADILAGDREFSSTDDDGNHWMHSSILCSEILELFQRLGEGDALFRTKLRRHGALKGVEEHVKRQPLGAGLPVLDMLRQR